MQCFSLRLKILLSSPAVRPLGGVHGEAALPGLNLSRGHRVTEGPYPLVPLCRLPGLLGLLRVLLTCYGSQPPGHGNRPLGRSG
jgi:hypothetical protein